MGFNGYRGSFFALVFILVCNATTQIEFVPEMHEQSETTDDVSWYEDSRALACLGASVLGAGLLYLWSQQRNRIIVPSINLMDKKKVYILVEPQMASVNALGGWYAAIVRESFGAGYTVIPVDSIELLSDDACAVFDMRYYSLHFENSYPLPVPCSARVCDSREARIREKIGPSAHVFLQHIRGVPDKDRFYGTATGLDSYTTVLPDLRFAMNSSGQYGVKNSEWDFIASNIKKMVAPQGLTSTMP